MPTIVSEWATVLPEPVFHFPQRRFWSTSGLPTIQTVRSKMPKDSIDARELTTYSPRPLVMNPDSWKD